ncbi:MAG: translation elongation factor 4 [Candidatus Pacebacteria bacterium]|jgi:GTP-binding protein LepA|nr:translation elongation factor 4 [Candidatus Paceibacterota bacterium]
MESDQSKLRNFVIISHVDHGKSTLADRFLELTGTVKKDKLEAQHLDMMDLEKERGITIKMQPVRMEYKGYVMNLIDTPGHVDFGYEVSRSLEAVEGAILLVDVAQGIQAQTLANLDLARKQNLVIIPAINKIDLPYAKVDEAKADLAALLGLKPEDIFSVSARSGLNVEQLLDEVIKKVPAPQGRPDNPLRALVFDSKYDLYQGVIAYVRMIDGKVAFNDKLYLIQNKVEGIVKETGYFKPQMEKSAGLTCGEIGYVATGVKDPEKVRVGETITQAWAYNEKTKTFLVQALPGYDEPKPMIFASVYPANADDFDDLKVALTKLKLSDPSFVFEPEMKEFLGRGYRCGFLGTLHAEIVCERLFREFDLDLIISSPSVVYKITDNRDRELTIYTTSDWPDPSTIKDKFEPWVKLEIVTPIDYLGPISDMTKEYSAIYIGTDFVGNEKMLLSYEIPMRKIVSGFYDSLKSVSQGYASMNYELTGYRPANLVKLEILINGEKEEAFAKIVPEEEAMAEGRRIATKLKEKLPTQMFALPIQAVLGGKVVARETLGAQRRDVTAPLYGGDVTRKNKLLKKQKEGKKKLQARGQVHIPPKVFMDMFKTN